LSLAELQGVSGDKPEQILATIEKAIAANPISAQARLALVRFHLARKQPKAAVSAAQDGLSAIPDNPQLVEALASSQILSGDTNQAIETFKKLVRLQPENALAFVRLAEAQVAAKDFPAAIENERRALALRPDSPEALAALAKTYIASGKPEAAIAEARKMQKEDRNAAVGYALEGDILATQRKWNEAASAFKSALERKPVAGVAARYYVVLENAGKIADADAMAQRWIAQNPKDVAIPLFLAERHQRRGQLDAAKAGYQNVLEIDPDDRVALNNLAWILNEQKDAKAVQYAERAATVAPLDPHVLDTYGWVLTQNGKSKRAVDVLRLATRLAPSEAAIRLHLAKALIESGDKAGAKQELSQLIALEKDSPARREAEKLQAAL
jgi:putative PEP-CTERM system TPR-repeat lipoprotein